MSEASADEVARSYAEELDELTTNSKPVINYLTMIAEDHLPHCAAVVSAIERKVLSEEPDRKLPFLYLLDSICKNVGGKYIEQFAKNIPSLVGGVYDVSSPKVRTAVHALIKTWNGVFPGVVVDQVNARVNASRATAGAGPVPAPAAHPSLINHAPSVPFLRPPMDIDRWQVGIGASGAHVGQGIGQKRLRESRDDQTGSKMTLRLELTKLMSQLRAHLQLGISQHSQPQQLVPMVQKAHTLCTQLMNMTTEGSHEAAVLHEERRFLLHMQESCAVPAPISSVSSPIMPKDRSPSVTLYLRARSRSTFRNIACLATCLFMLQQTRPASLE